MAEKWHVKTDGNWTELPTTGSVVVLKYAVGEPKEYRMVEIVTANDRWNAVNQAGVEGWQYVSEFIPGTKPTKTLLSGYKEGNDNDWAPTTNGYIQVEYDIKMLRQQVNARLQTLPNEVDNFDGVDYVNVIFGKTSVEQKAAALADVIQNIPAVKQVTFINASWIDKAAGTFRFTFNIQSIFGDLQFQMGLDVQNLKVLENNE